MAFIQLDFSGRDGLAPYYGGDRDRDYFPTIGENSQPNLRYLGSQNQFADGIFNPFRRFGYLSPANNTFTDLSSDSPLPTGRYMKTTVYDVDNNDVYFGENRSKIYKLDGLDDTSLSLQRDISLTDDLFDLEIYVVNDVKKLFYITSTTTAGIGKIGIADLPFSNPDDNWFSSTATGGFTLTHDAPMFMRVADNGFAYVFNDNEVHKIDGTINGGANGTVTGGVLAFPQTFQMTDAVDYRGLMFIALRQDEKSFGLINEDVFNSSVGIYVWDRLSTAINTRDYIPIQGVRSIQRMYISPAGRLRIITNDSENFIQIREFNGSQFDVIKTLGRFSAPVYTDGLTNISLLTVWLGQDKNIYAHGRLSELDKEALYKIGQVEESGSLILPGAISFGGSTSNPSSGGYKTYKSGLYLSFRDLSGVDRKVQEWDMYGTGAASNTGVANTGNIYTKVNYLPLLSNIKQCTIYCMPTEGNDDTVIATVKFYKNQQTTPFSIKPVTKKDASKGYIQFQLNQQNVNATQIKIEYENVAIGPDDFSPSIGVLEYSPTGSRG